MCMDTDELVKGINQMRKSLISIAKETGLNSNETLYCSKELDELITRYQKTKNEK